MSSVTWPVRTQEAKGKRPVAPPRTSPRQHQEESSAADMASPRPVARARPALSPRDGKLKLFERDPDVDGYVVEQTKHLGSLERDAENFGYKRDRGVEQKPVVPVRRKTIEETRDEDTGRDARVYESERTTSVSVEKPMAPSRRKKTIEETRERRKDDEFYENGKGKSLSGKPMAPSRTKKTIEETHERRKGDEFYENERGKSLSGKPMAPSRSKKAVDREETHEKLREKDDGVYETPKASPRNEKTVKEMHEKRKGRDRGVDEYERTRSLSENPPMAPSRRKKTFEETYEESREKVDAGYEYDKTAFRREKSLEETYELHSRAQIPVIRTSTFEDDGPFLDRGRREMVQYGNLRSGQRPVSSVTRSDSTEKSEDEDDSGRVLYRKGSFGSKNYDQEEMDDDRRVADGQEKSVNTPPRPSPRCRSMVDDILKAHSKVTQPEEEVKPTKRPGSALTMKKASSLETLSSKQGSLSKKVPSGSSEHGTQRVQLKKSLAPQRPMSGKKGSLLSQLRQKAQADATDTFEEHVPTVENVIGTTTDDRGVRKKGAWDTGKI